MHDEPMVETTESQVPVPFDFDRAWQEATSEKVAEETSPSTEASRESDYSSTGESNASEDSIGNLEAGNSDDAGYDGGFNSLGDILDGFPAETVQHFTNPETYNQIATALDTKIEKIISDTVTESMAEDFKGFYDRLGMRPDELLGQEVRNLDAEGDETIILRDLKEATTWQQQVREALEQERGRRVQEINDSSNTLQTAMHNGLNFLANNPDMIPGHTHYNKKLHDLASPILEMMAVRGDNGKLLGFSLDVNDVMAHLRAHLATVRKPATPKTSEVKPEAQTKPEDLPQAGIRIQGYDPVEPGDFSPAEVAILLGKGRLQ